MGCVCGSCAALVCGPGCAIPTLVLHTAPFVPILSCAEAVLFQLLPLDAAPPVFPCRCVVRRPPVSLPLLLILFRVFSLHVVILYYPPLLLLFFVFYFPPPTYSLFSSSSAFIIFLVFCHHILFPLLASLPSSPRSTFYLHTFPSPQLFLLPPQYRAAIAALTCKIHKR